MPFSDRRITAVCFESDFSEKTGSYSEKPPDPDSNADISLVTDLVQWILDISWILEWFSFDLHIQTQNSGQQKHLIIVFIIQQVCLNFH